MIRKLMVKTIMKNIKWRLLGLKVASFILSGITLGIPTLVKFINQQIKELEKIIEDEIKNEEN